MIDDICKKQLTNPNPVLYSDSLWEIAKGHCTYFRTIEAFYVSMCSCATSAISSSLVIYIILISQTRLSSIYHRIIFAMCICDILYSVSAGLSTLPMPAPGDLWTDINNFEGPRIGNIHTCAAQGFFFGMSLDTYYYYYTCLLIYCICVAVFKMTNETIERYLEPFMHSISISIPAYHAIASLLHGDYNASFQYLVCTSVPKPWFCNNDNNGGVECVRGKSSKTQLFLRTFVYEEQLMFLLWITLWFFICAFVGIRYYRLWVQPSHNPPSTSFASSEHKENGNLDSLSSQVEGSSEFTSFFGSEDLGGDSQTSSIQQERLEETKIIAIQTVLYATGLALVFLSWFSIWDKQEQISNMWHKSILFALSYSQGCMNLFIFVFHKVYNLRKNNPLLPIQEAIMEVFKTGGISDVIVITELDVVRAHQPILDERSRQKYMNYFSFYRTSQQIKRVIRDEGPTSRYQDYEVEAVGGSIHSKSSLSAFLFSTGDISSTERLDLSQQRKDDKNDLAFIDEYNSYSSSEHHIVENDDTSTL